MMMPSVYELPGDDSYSVVLTERMDRQDPQSQRLPFSAPNKASEMLDLFDLSDQHDTEVHQGFLKTMSVYQLDKADDDMMIEAPAKTQGIPSTISFTSTTASSSSCCSQDDDDDSTIASAPASNANAIMNFLLERQRNDESKKRSWEASPLPASTSLVSFLLTKQRREKQGSPPLDSVNIASAMEFLAQDRCIREGDAEDALLAEELTHYQHPSTEQPPTKRARVSITGSESTAVTNHERSSTNPDPLLEAFDESFERLRRENALLRQSLGISTAPEALQVVAQEFANLDASSRRPEDGVGSLDDDFFLAAAQGEEHWEPLLSLHD